MQSLGNLTEFAVQFRYEILEEYDSQLDRTRYLNTITELIEFVKKQLEA